MVAVSKWSIEDVQAEGVNNGEASVIDAQKRMREVVNFMVTRDVAGRN